MDDRTTASLCQTNDSADVLGQPLLERPKPQSDRHSDFVVEGKGASIKKKFCFLADVLSAKSKTRTS